MVAFLCRQCCELGHADRSPVRCPSCGSPRVISHTELESLHIAHVDCDAFYASVEKRDHPELRDKPLIIGGGQRGVVSTCCYIARQSGVHSAMPAVTAKRLCPDAVFMRPDMAKYVAVSKQIRALMDALTPEVEPLSIDEAFLDLHGTLKLFKAPPALLLARLARQVEEDIGVTISVGLSHNKFLAKIASDLDKPRGFAVIGEAETIGFLSPKPIGIIYGVGKVFSQKLAKDGFTTIGQLQKQPKDDLIRRYGEMGGRLSRLAFGRDARPVQRNSGAKSISSETTFFNDLGTFEELSAKLMQTSEHLSGRMKARNLVGSTLTLKLKTAGFRTRTRACHLPVPTQLAHTIYEHASHMLLKELDGTAFRLIGVGLSGLEKAREADAGDLIDPQIARKHAAERAMDKVREKFGRDAMVRGKLYRGAKPRTESRKESENDRKTKT